MPEQQIREVVVKGEGGHFVQSVEAGPHRFRLDEPTAYGGADAAPNPYDLLLASLGACTSMTLGAYARRKQWPLEQVVVRLSHHRVHAEDCENCEDRNRKIERIERHITLTGPLSEEQRARLLQIAELCPVHKTLTGDLQIRTELA